MLLIVPNQPLPTAQTEHEARALDFCRRWQAGEIEFELHTSGSTGTPKLIRLTRAQMRASAHLTGRTFGLKSGDSALCGLNVNYIAGTMMLVRALELGLRLMVVEPVANPLEGLGTGILQVAESPWSGSGTQPFAFHAFVPLQLQTILTTAPEFVTALDRAKAILVGGAAVSSELEAVLQVIQAPVFNTYGMTETVSHVAVRRLNGPERSDAFRVLDGVAVGTDERGCLWVQGAVTNDERVQTNDVVALEDARRFRLLGRADLVINSGGVKIQLQKVEQAVAAALREMNRDQSFLAWFLPHASLGQQLIGIWEKELPQPVDLQKIESFLRKQLSRYELPKRWFVSPEFRYTPTGKLDRRATVAAIANGGSDS
jgi:O-succinylbenzoic acid--CoA ligase